MKAVTPEERGQVFLAALSPTRRSQLEGSEKLDEELTEIVASAKSAWREVEIEEATFLRYVAARVPAEKAAGDLFTDDLFLACACAEGNARALAAFEEVYAPLMSAAVRHMSLDAAVVDEIKQRVRTLLFVGSAESAAKIVDYAGLGELAGWLRVSTVRVALRLVRKTAEVLVEDDQLLGLADPKMPALDVAVEEYRAAFKVAFKVALASLSALEKTALKQHYLDRLTLDEMAALHATHRTTVARWLRQAREAVFQRTREKMMESTRASSSACDSILRGVRSQLDVTMQSLFE